MGLFGDKKGSGMYESDVKLGERYRDGQTGIEGHATCVTFFQHGCERATLETVVGGKIEEYSFDAPRLTSVETGERAETKKVGGPMRGSSHVRPSGAGRQGHA